MQKIEIVRLIADEGKILTNGEKITPCIDVLAEKADNWTEIDAEDIEPEKDNE